MAIIRSGQPIRQPQCEVVSHYGDELGLAIAILFENKLEFNGKYGRNIRIIIDRSAKEKSLASVSSKPNLRPHA